MGKLYRYSHLNLYHDFNVHCKSKDNNLGDHVIHNNEYYHWEFRPNIWGTTSFVIYHGEKENYRMISTNKKGITIKDVDLIANGMLPKTVHKVSQKS
jgi:hypothetical protein